MYRISFMFHIVVIRNSVCLVKLAPLQHAHIVFLDNYRLQEKSKRVTSEPIMTKSKLADAAALFAGGSPAESRIL